MKIDKPFSMFNLLPLLSTICTEQYYSKICIVTHRNITLTTYVLYINKIYVSTTKQL